MGSKFFHAVTTTSSEIVSWLKVREIGGVVGFIAAPFVIMYSFLKFLSIPAEHHDLILALTICIVFGLFLFFVLYREYTASRKERYANITEKLHACMHEARDMQTYLDDLCENDMRGRSAEWVFTIVAERLTRALDSFSSLFSMLTGTRCRATIKVIYEKDDSLFVRVIARDTDSYERNQQSDKKRYLESQDPIEENEDFALLYNHENPTESYFFCNNLLNRTNYVNSSTKVYGNANPHMGLWDRISCRSWTLPYRSAITWPIRQKANPRYGFDDIGCIGFLSIDSESRGVFKRSYDPWIGAGFADSLFHPLKKLYNLAARAEEDKNAQQLPQE